MKLQHFSNYWWIGGVEHYILSLIAATPDWEHAVHVRHSVHPDAQALLQDAGIVLTFGQHYPIEPDADVLVMHNQSSRAPNYRSSGKPVVSVTHGFPLRLNGLRPYCLDVSVNSFGARLIEQTTNVSLPAAAPGLPEPPCRKQSYVLSEKPSIGLVASPRAQKLSTKLVASLNLVARSRHSIRLRALGLAGFDRFFRDADFEYELLEPAVGQAKWEFLAGLDLGFYTVGCQEGFGIAPMEMLAAGLPTVADAAGGILDQITHRQNGLLNRTPREAAVQIVALLLNQKLRERLAENALARIATEYSLEAMRGRWERIVEKVNDLAKYRW